MTQSTDLELRRFAELMQAYGADFARWPDEYRSAGRQLVLRSSEARELRAQAGELDAWLERAPDLEPSAKLQASVDAIPERFPRVSWWPFRSHLVPALALAAAAVLGITAGHLAFSSASASSSSESTLAADEEDWEELSELAFSAELDSEDWP